MILGFKSQFVEAVQSGRKKMTIRPLRKGARQWRVGDTAYIYTGAYGADRRLVGIAEIARVTTMWIYPRLREIEVEYAMCRDQPMTPEAIEALARADGFQSTAAFWEFFQNAEDRNPYTKLEWDEINLPGGEIR